MADLHAADVVRFGVVRDKSATRHRKSKYAIPLLPILILCWLLAIAATSQAASQAYVRSLTIASGAPVAVTADDQENLYVIDGGNNKLDIYNSGGIATGTIRELAGPIGVAVDGRGRIFIGSGNEGSVNIYGPDGVFLYALGAGKGEFTRPIAIGVDTAGNAYVVDAEAHRVKVFHQDGSPAFSFGGHGGEDGRFNNPTALAVNGASLIIADLPVIDSSQGPHEGARIQIFDLQGNFISSFGEYGVGEGKLAKPLGLAVDAGGRIYVADAYQNVIQIFDGDGLFLGTVYDQAEPLRSPLDIAVGLSTGRLFIASRNNAGIEVYSKGGQHTIMAGAEEGGIISPAGAVAVTAGGSQIFTISPAPGYQIADVLVDGVSQGARTTYAFTHVAAGHTIRVSFVSVTQTITAGAGLYGTISPSGAVVVPTGGSQIFTITPEEGSRIADLLVDGVSVGAPAVYTFTAVTESHSIEALFIHKGHTITALSTSGGSISPAGPVAVARGSEQTFAITPEPSYRIADLKVDGVSQGALTSYTFLDVAVDHTIEAQFGTSYALTVTVTGNGTVISSPAGIDCPGTCSAEFASGAEVILTAVAEEGAAFVGWHGDFGSSGAQCVLSMDKPLSIGAFFVADIQDDGFEFGDLSGLPWLTGDSTGASGWLVQADVRHTGGYAAQTPVLNAGETAFLEVGLELTEADDVSFWHRVSAAAGSFLSVAVDGVEQGRWTGNDWTEARFGVAAGRHTFRWEYRAGADGGAWLDDIRFPAHAAVSYPVIDIKANTFDGPLSLAAESVLVTIGILGGELVGEEAEWWLIGETPFGWMSYDQHSGSWQPGSFVTYQGPIADIVTHVPVLAVPDLPAGLYTLYFGIDRQHGGGMDDEAAYDAVILRVGEQRE